MREKVYISGPITGIPSLNIQAFRDAEQKIRSMGMNPVVPHDLFEGIDTQDFKWEDFMRGCIKCLMDCDAVITIEGWNDSEEARIEVDLARKLKMDVFPLHNIKQLANEMHVAAEETEVQMNKLSLERRVYNFIAHSEVLEKVSKQYNKMGFAMALDKSREIKKAIKYHEFNMPKRELARQILQHQKSLYAILPSTKNVSYQNSLQKLQTIISDAQQLMNPINPLIKILQQQNINGITGAQRQ